MFLKFFILKTSFSKNLLITEFLLSWSKIKKFLQKWFFTNKIYHWKKTISERVENSCISGLVLLKNSNILDCLDKIIFDNLIRKLHFWFNKKLVKNKLNYMIYFEKNITKIEVSNLKNYSRISTLSQRYFWTNFYISFCFTETFS